MSNIIWRTPEPSADFSLGVKSEFLPKRQFKLMFECNGNASGITDEWCVLFDGVVNLEIKSSFTMSADETLDYYDKLVQNQISETLCLLLHDNEVRNAANYHEFSICFDKGPFYRVIAESWSVRSHETRMLKTG